MQNHKADWFFKEESKWKLEYEQLRSIALQSGLTEEVKWGCPCYTLLNANIVLIHGFTQYCALLFHKGVLLQDPYNLLIQQTKNVQVPRQMRFTNVDEIIAKASKIQEYIQEAIQIEKSGSQIALKKTSEYEIPIELQSFLDENVDIKNAFNALTPGRQRGYLLYFSQPKQSKTIIARIEKSIPNILAGKGPNE